MGSAGTWPTEEYKYTSEYDLVCYSKKLSLPFNSGPYLITKSYRIPLIKLYFLFVKRACIFQSAVEGFHTSVIDVACGLRHTVALTGTQ